MLYADANDAFRQLLLGHYGRLPLGFPPEWVYQSAFGPDYKRALLERTENSPLESLPDLDIKAEHKALRLRLGRQPLDEELVMYLNHPGDALKTIEFRSKFGDPNNLPLDVWFEGLEPGQELTFQDSRGKPHMMVILDISEPDDRGLAMVRYTLDAENLSTQVKVAEPRGLALAAAEMADPGNVLHVAAPCNGELWVMHVSPGDFVKAGEELFNISVMKQEKAVFAPVDGMVKRVLKDANFQESKKMVPVKEGELLIELGPVPKTCPGCKEPLTQDEFNFCPFCGVNMLAESAE